MAVQYFLPPILLVIILLSLRTDTPSFRNWIIVVLGALAAWAVTPSASSWGMAICLGLLVLAIVLSPLQKIFFRASAGRYSPNPINVLYNPPDAQYDIVAVHGLGSSVESTWRHPVSDKVWLRDFLHLDIPDARIMTFRHNTQWSVNSEVKDLRDYGKQLLSAIESVRSTDETQDRPILLIGHSFGGLLIQQALVTAKRAAPDQDIGKRHLRLADSLAGIVFLGTPHAGSGYTAIGKLICHLTYWGGSSTVLLSAIDPKSKVTRDLEDEFLSGYGNVKSVDFYETMPNMILGFRVNLIVNKDAATRAGRASEPLDTDHFGLNKYQDYEDSNYITVRSWIVSTLKLKTTQNRDRVDEEGSKNIEILKWLKPCCFYGTTEKHSRDLIPGTCEWIMQENEYRKWSLGKNILWIFGKPGSGKSFIAFYICKQLQQRNHLVMQFSFDSKSAGNVALQCLVNFYQTILHQLLQAVSKNHPKSKAACFDVVRKRKLAEDTEQDSFKDAIKQILEIVGPTFLVIDALDECKEDDDPQLLQEWLAREDQHPGLKVLITSRPEQRILDVKDLSLFISLELNSLVDKSNNDIRLFIQARLRKSKDLPNIDNIHQSIERKLMTKANGMILYTSLMLTILENKGGENEEILAQMEQLPTDIEKLYEQRLKQIADEPFAMKMFQWLVTCRRPLTIHGLLDAYKVDRAVQRAQSFDPEKTSHVVVTMTIDKFRRDMFKNCLPLVEVLKDDTVRIVHTTVTQYLLGKSIKGASGSPIIYLDQAHEHVALTCLTYLRGVGKCVEAECVWDSDGLRNYAVLEWSEHSQKSEERIIARPPEREVLIMFCKEQAFRAWLNDRARMDHQFRVHFSIEGTSVQYPTPLHIAVYLNLSGLAQHLLDHLNSQDAAGSTPLHVAASQNYSTIVQNLLYVGARTDIQDIYGSFAIHRAARRGHHAALEELIKGKANINAKDKYKFMPLHIACQSGWTGCVKMLLAHGAEIPTESDSIETPLGLAVTNGHYDVVLALLEHGKSLITSCGKPLVQAARKGRTKMVMFLCDNGADMSHTDPSGQTALHKACISGHKNLVEFLLSKPQITVDPLDQSNRTPLYFAAERGYLEIVNLLIEHKADVNSLDRRQETAMFKPAGNGHKAVVERLLIAGTDPTILDMWKRTPLRFAAKKGHIDIVRLLLAETHIDQNLPDWMGRSVLHVAAAYLRDGQEEVIDVLFRQRERCSARADTRGLNRGNALHAAIWRTGDQPSATKALVQKLLDYNVPLNSVDNLGRTPLTLAIRTKNLEVVHLLLQYGALPNENALHSAVQTGDVSLVTALIKAKSELDLTERNWYYETALHVAVKQGYDEILKELLKTQIPTGSLDRDKTTALMKAEELKREKVSNVSRYGDLS